MQEEEENRGENFFSGGIEEGGGEVLLLFRVMRKWGRRIEGRRFLKGDEGKVEVFPSQPTLGCTVRGKVS